MLISGVDLAAEPKGTAVATIDWQSAHAELVDLQLGVDDRQIIDACEGSIKVGIDCALGWPVDFVDFVARQASAARLTSDDTGDLAWRRRLAPCLAR